MAGMMLKASGTALIVLGAMWALQGLGILTWPAQSFMIAQREWALYGGVTALVGAAILWLGVRLAARRKP
jgi:hypothetical protein